MADVSVGERQLGAGDGRIQPGEDIGRQYAQVSALLVPVLAALAWLASATPTPVSKPTVLLGPVFALLTVTAVVFLLMLTGRHASVLLRRTPIDYFRDFKGAEAPAWAERPSRAFDNLMQLPPVFYAGCAFMLQLGLVDSVQLQLAWVFVAARAIHAVLFIGWNAVRFRFATWFVGTAALGILLCRFGLQSAHLWL